MRWRSRPWHGGGLGILGLILILGAALIGCDNDPGPLDFPDENDDISVGGSGDITSESGDPSVVLKQVIQLIQSAATNPGGENFTLATESLNDYFAGAEPEDFALPEDEAAFLNKQLLPPGAPKSIANPRFSGLLDGRHIEDCMLYRGVATAILQRHGSDADDDLSRARHLFDWVIRQVQLVPPGTLAPPPELLNLNGQTFQARARPFDAMLRGLATEVNANWAERSGVFLALCQQVGLDAGLLAITPAEVGQGVLLPEGGAGDEQEAVATEPPLPALACGVLINGQVYLFDCRIGLPIPGPDGQGVATLEQAASDPAILDHLSLPKASYPIRSEDLSQGRVRVLLASSLGSLAPRMKRLQERLTGENRMILYRNPAEVAHAFAAAIGSRLESVRLWGMPLEVEYRLFHDAQFTAATLHTIRLFDARWPLLQARLDQLRGETETAINRYVSFRYAEGLLESDGKTPIAPEVAAILNLYATQFLALAQLDRGWDDQAESLFLQSLKLFPEPGPGQPYLNMFRWGACSNLGRLYEEGGQPLLAVRYYSQDDPTAQSIGNRLRARPLIWSDPFVPDAALPTLPPPPAPLLPTFRPAPAPDAGTAPASPPSGSAEEKTGSEAESTRSNE